VVVAAVAGGWLLVQTVSATERYSIPLKAQTRIMNSERATHAWAGCAAGGFPVDGYRKWTPVKGAMRLYCWTPYTTQSPDSHGVTKPYFEIKFERPSRGRLLNNFHVEVAKGSILATEDVRDRIDLRTLKLVGHAWIVECANFKRSFCEDLRRKVEKGSREGW
jgi:hypothetical protein